ncbi:Putative S-adenosyl-L-methionine-dependent methyltransferase [Mycobacterium persicum]|uniref:S-adenosyl-L-methionine-dependent methyltransferase n=1 Tax=Mycobacterium persicum TaxID=1487726 RepID=A0AB38UPM7_9MYCO|nr:Putative S-adenosyl-L-methionine-dependent methyltransferase [Mycobacterium persicum]
MGRTENDTWDLASSVGATATMVAASRARATRAALIDDPLAEPLVRAVGIDFFIRWASDELRPEDVDLPDAPWGMQRMTDQQAARTRYIDAFFVAAQHDGMPAGIRQVVILTSGLDTRGYRPPWARGTTVFEIDVAQVFAFKTTALAENYYCTAAPRRQAATREGNREGFADAERHTCQATRRVSGPRFHPERRRSAGRTGAGRFGRRGDQDRGARR